MNEELTSGAPRKMLTIEDILKIVPLHIATIYRMQSDGTFPRSHMVGKQKRFWFADEIAAWQEKLAEASE